jgi:hypothetical protein
MTKKMFRGITTGLFCLLAQASLAAEVGTVAALQGDAHVERGGAVLSAGVGTPVEQGDVLVTGEGGKLRVVFQDDSVLTLSENSRVVVEDSVFEPAGRTARSLFGLLKGKLNAAVSEYYRLRGNAYEVRTETAVAGVRGTEFAVAFDPASERTEVVSIEGTVQVHSLRDPQAPAVLVRAREVTVVEPVGGPAAPRRLDEPLFRERIEGFDFVSRGRPEGIISAMALASGSAALRLGGETLVTEGVAPGAEVGAVKSVTGDGDATGKLGQPPAGIRFTGQLGLDLGR